MRIRCGRRQITGQIAKTLAFSQYCMRWKGTGDGDGVVKLDRTHPKSDNEIHDISNGNIKGSID